MHCQLRCGPDFLLNLFELKRFFGLLGGLCRSITRIIVAGIANAIDDVPKIEAIGIVRNE